MAQQIAITIGINHYEHERSLECAENDAVAMGAYLQEIGFNEVLCYSDASDRSKIPKRFNLLQAIKRISDRVHLSKEDSFWFFFSGHGGIRQGRDYLLPNDGAQELLEDTAIETDRVIRALKRCGAGNLVFILDMCRNEIPSKSIGAQTATLAQQQGVITLFSCSPGEQSYEMPDIGQGIFTYALLEALRNNSFPIHWNAFDLGDHLSKRVLELSKPYGIQRPYIIAEKTQLLLPLQQSKELFKLEYSQATLQSDIDELKVSELKREIEKTLILPSVPNSKPFNFKSTILNTFGKEIFQFSRESKSITENINGTKLEMVLIPGGKFLMGSIEEKWTPNAIPTHFVELKSFLISKYTITKAQWRAILQSEEFDYKLPKLSFSSKDKNHPVVQVSWHDAVNFCKFLSEKLGYLYRLPSESEWEYACRAGTTTPFYCGETITPSLANYDGNFPYYSEGKGIYRGKTTQVGHFKFANPFGLFDMHGNVWEWCQDSWHKNYENAPESGDAWSDRKDNLNRVIRGGSWINEALKCQSSFRDFGNVNLRSKNTGFRIVREF
ncbi:MAG: SUMF1/EgtB/PvdO family nonheme iron enzyme [Elainellaceae cyanobacterium]